MTEKVKKKSRNMILAVAGVLVIIFGALLLYSNDYYRSEVSVEDCISDTQCTIEEITDGIFVDGTGNKEAIIFYPGAKVEYTAYLPLCVKLAEQGVDCFLVKMPFHLAIFGMNKAGNIMDNYSYDNWYLAGHSLGGAMAANYVADNVEHAKWLEWCRQINKKYPAVLPQHYKKKTPIKISEFFLYLNDLSYPTFWTDYFTELDSC